MAVKSTGLQLRENLRHEKAAVVVDCVSLRTLLQLEMTEQSGKAETGLDYKD